MTIENPTATSTITSSGGPSMVALNSLASPL
eukprot:CAMPEP_0172617230 /NCGR_PEP_ID=MMETSP1068-20121228/70125_1 /TAXON_ID=35684 /ORGANISM="Pseudopedinella elastica, Strain CCMP716" /LENGTH=30 /DNA_ID= /DNA_START= /DNA_END= /DNA_ORIENTATION=